MITVWNITFLLFVSQAFLDQEEEDQEEEQLLREDWVKKLLEEDKEPVEMDFDDLMLFAKTLSQSPPSSPPLS